MIHEIFPLYGTPLYTSNTVCIVWYPTTSNTLYRDYQHKPPPTVSIIYQWSPSWGCLMWCCREGLVSCGHVLMTNNVNFHVQLLLTIFLNYYTSKFLEPCGILSICSILIGRVSRIFKQQYTYDNFYYLAFILLTNHHTF